MFLAVFICILLSLASKSLNLVLFVLLFFISAFLFVFFLLSKKRKSGLIICMAIISIFSFLTVKMLVKLNKVDEINGKNVYLSAVVCETKEERNDIYKSCKIKILNSENDVFCKGDKLVCNYISTESLSLGARLDGEFSISNLDLASAQFSFVADGCVGIVYTENIRIGDSGIFIYEFTNKIQNFIKTTLLSKTDNSGLLIGMLYGERGFISDNLLDNVKSCGVSHVLVVSGLHFAIICSGFIKLCNLITKRQKIKDLLQLIFVFVFCCVCGFTVSVIRAATIYVLLIIYRNMKRGYSGFVAWADALLLTLFIHPAAFHSISFQLSYAAVLGLLVLYPQFLKAIKYKFSNRPLLTIILNCAAVSLSAFIATFPTCAYYFGYVSTVAILVNLLISLAVSIMLVCGVMGVVFAYLNLNFLVSVLFFITDALADYFRKTVHFFASLPYCTVSFNNTALLTVFVLLLYFGIYLLYTCKKRPYLVKLFKEKVRRVKSAVCK